MKHIHNFDSYGYQTTEGFVPLLTQIGAVYKEKKNIEFKHTQMESFLNEGQEDPVQLTHPFCGCGCPVTPSQKEEETPEEGECNNAVTGETSSNE